MADEQHPGIAQIAEPLATAMLHDPLPESTWGWRRGYIFAVTAASIAGIWMMAQSIRDLAPNNPDLAVKALLKIIGWILMLDWCVVTYYLIAPTGEQITRWVQTAGMLKQGVQFATSALVTGPRAIAQTSTVAGQAVQPPVIDAAPTAR